MKIGNKVKVHTYCPKDSLDQVRVAIGNANGGVIGNYKFCSFVTEGFGYFLPTENAMPNIGEIGKHEKVAEYKIEFICNKTDLQNIIKAIKDAHPYEEVPIDIFPLVEL